MPCVYTAKGQQVLCLTEGFTLLTDELSQANQRADLAEIKESDVAGRLVLVTDDLQACALAALTAPAPAPLPVPPPFDLTWPLVGYGAGVAGTAGLAATLTLDLSTGARVASGGLSLVSLALGVWLILPDQS